MTGQARASMWTALSRPEVAHEPNPIAFRMEDIPRQHFFPGHTHPWGQLIYATSGVLAVSVEGARSVVPSHRAVWVPKGMLHEVGSRLGATYRSVYVADVAKAAMPTTCATYTVTPLFRELILEAARPTSEQPARYRRQLFALILSHLQRMKPACLSVPWPAPDSPLNVLCEALYANPADNREMSFWARLIGLSIRSLSRRLDGELGMGLREWRNRVRVLKAVELLEQGASVTTTALSLGYASTSAFSYAFRKAVGHPPRRVVEQTTA